MNFCPHWKHIHETLCVTGTICIILLKVAPLHECLNTKLRKASHITHSHMALEVLLRKSNIGQNKISFMEQSISNKLRNDLKFLNTITLFTHKYKGLDFKNVSK